MEHTTHFAPWVLAALAKQVYQQRSCATDSHTIRSLISCEAHDRWHCNQLQFVYDTCQ